MEHNRNSESPRDAYDSFDWENWDGQDSSVPEEPWVPDATDLLLHPELADLAGQEQDGEGEEGSGPEHPKRRAEPPPAPAPPPPARWEEPPPHVPAPEDSGFYYRNGRPIPPTHPDHGPMHLIPRQHDGSFAAYYYCSKAQLAAARVPAPPPRRHRRDGFTPERQQRFVEAFRNTGSLTDAARITGISRSTAYNLINRADGEAFRAALAEAGKGVDTLLEATAIERAVKGHEEIVYHKGRRVGVRWKADNRLLMSLLRARNPLKYAPLSEIEGWLKRRGLEPPADVEGALDRLAAAEAEWGRRLPGEGARADPLVPAALEGPDQPAPPALDAPDPARPEEPPRQVEAASRSTVAPPSAHPEEPPSEVEAASPRTGSSASDAELPAPAHPEEPPSEVEAASRRTDLSTSEAETASQASISSTSEAEFTLQASNLSTLNGGFPRHASNSSTSPLSAHPEEPPSAAEVASRRTNSSTWPASAHPEQPPSEVEAASRRTEPPAGPITERPPADAPLFYRPPPRPRLIG
jgi:hypothetical protein